MNKTVIYVSIFFHDIIEEIQKQIKAVNGYTLGREQKLGRINESSFSAQESIVKIFQIAKLKADIDHSKEKLKMLKEKLEEINLIQKMFPNKDYESAILLFKEIEKEYPEDFLNKHLVGDYPIELIHQMKEVLMG
jgi:flagellar biosynthesis chaperone FliJ